MGSKAWLNYCIQTYSNKPKNLIAATLWRMP
jgi:hypothetical protein